MKLNIKYALLAALALFALAAPSYAQTVTQQPQFAAPRSVLDLGNGPLEIRMVTGSAGLFTSQGSGVGSTSGSSTTLTLTATPATPPCVGCQISGTGITAGTTVAAFNGTTTITLSAAMTVAASTALAWGAACPAVSPQSGVPPQPYTVAMVQAAVGADLPLYTGARICLAGMTGPGGQFVSFAIGAH
jgi:hypothetical protein